MLFLAAVCVGAILSCTPYPEYDLFWQLRTGHDIVRTLAVPHTDVYSWTRHGSPWVVQEWLTFVLYWLAYSGLRGFAGIVAIKTIVVAIISGSIYSYFCRAARYRLLPAFLLTVLSLWAAESGFESRPQLFTYLFLVL